MEIGHTVTPSPPTGWAIKGAGPSKPAIHRADVSPVESGCSRPEMSAALNLLEISASAPAACLTPPGNPTHDPDTGGRRQDRQGRSKGPRPRRGSQVRALVRNSAHETALKVDGRLVTSFSGGAMYESKRRARATHPASRLIYQYLPACPAPHEMVRLQRRWSSPQLFLLIALVFTSRAANPQIEAMPHHGTSCG